MTNANYSKNMAETLVRYSQLWLIEMELSGRGDVRAIIPQRLSILGPQSRHTVWWSKTRACRVFHSGD